MNPKHLLTTILLASGLIATAQESTGKVSRTFHVSQPGTLVEQMTEEEANAITDLTLQGKLNAIDFRHLRDEFKSLQTLDISNASISLYAGKAGTSPDKFYLYPANCIPAYAFCRQTSDSTFVGKTSLKRVVLSDKTKNIEDAAFKGCTNLQIVQIRKKSAPNLMKEALADSTTAVFVPLGSSDSYRNKARWESFAFIEGDPVTAHVRITRTGSLAGELMQAGLQPKEVNFLTVEGKLDAEDFKVIRDYMPNLVSIDLSACNATALPDYTFTQKKYLLNVTLPAELRSIGQRAFSGCARLCGTLTLPATVTAIEYGAFIGCAHLRYVVATGNQITTLGENLFDDCPAKLIYK